MGKFRSKLKGSSKGLRWRKGQSSSSNPTTTKHRDLANSKFFHESLGDGALTADALKKHNAIHLFGHGLANGDASIAESLRNVSIDDDDDATTFKTFQTFASDWSACSNASFTRLLNGFDPKCALHKEMLAILAAITEVIKEKGGAETSTEYYAALMETLKACENDDGIAATVSLISMGLKSVPQPVLQKQFSDASVIFLDLLEKYSESDHYVILRCIIGCMSVFLRSLDYATWGYHSTMKAFEAILAFAVHSKPKVRKCAHHAVCAIMRGSCFMLPTDDLDRKVIKLHPAANKVAAVCNSQMKAEVLLANQTTVLHILTLLTEVIAYFSKENIKTCCESLLSLMTQNDIIVKTWCLKTLHSLFVNSTDRSHLTSSLAVQLIRALTAYRPSAIDTRQTVAWVTVMQHAYLCLAKLDLATCMSSLPNFVQICVTELWLCDSMEITSTSSNTLKAILIDCVKPACATEENVTRYSTSIDNIFKSIKTGLDNPFNQAIKQVILTIAVCFEVGNINIKSMLAPLLIHLNERRESNNFTHNKEMEYAVGCAVKSIGPKFVMECIPLRASSDSINLDRSWLLIVFKERIQNSSLKIFIEDILSLASLCRNKAKTSSATGDAVNAHTYELLCGQLWALLPNFCNGPDDVNENFKGIARTLGTVLKDNPDFRSSVMQALRKLITSSHAQEDIEEIGRFAKNFIPLLLNIYMTPAKGNYGEGQRLAALETIQVYLTITPQNLRLEFFQNALERLDTKDDLFSRESLLDIVRVLALYQDGDKIAHLFDKWVFPLCEEVSEDTKNTKKKGSKTKSEEDASDDLKNRNKFINMEHKKAYRILEEIFKSDSENCKRFLQENLKKIRRMLMQSLNRAADSSKTSRLRCIQYMIKLQPNLDHDSKLIKSALPEAVICTKDINSKCRQCAFDLIITIGETLQHKANGLDHFTAMLEMGLQGSPNVMTSTILCLASATYNFSAALGVQNLQRIMENICQLLKTNDRQVVGACLAYLKVYTKSLPSPLVAGSLPVIFKSIGDMHDDCKRHSRTDLSNLLTRLTRKYGADTIGSLIPQSDEGMQRKLRHTRKMDSRKKRLKEKRKQEKANEESDDDIKIKGSSKTLEEILKDSDSELDMDDESQQLKSTKSKKKTNQSWIREDEDNIVDLMDSTAARNITATQPTPKGDIVDTKKKKKKEIKTTPDGKLILDFDNDSDSESDSPKKRIAKDSDDSDELSDDDLSTAETLPLSSGKKRKYDDIRSQKSGKSGISNGSSKWSQPQNKYRTGGKGIHRNVTGNIKIHSGEEYRSKKARGDMKQKGRPDPYAYMPLIKNSMNKRKRKKAAGQFKNIIRGVQKGVAAGRVSKAKTKTKK